MDGYNNDDNQPIIVTFENGVLKREMKEQVTFRYLRSKIGKSRKKLLVADTPSLSYTGSVLPKLPIPMTYHVGIVDEVTNRIIRVEKCQICTLKPKLKDENESDLNKSKTEKSFREKNDSLIEAFGSAKQKRLLSSRRKNEDVRSTISDKVASVAKNLPTPDNSPLKSESPAASDVAIIPPKNDNATTINDIYRIDDIISFQDYQALLGLSQHFLKCEQLQQWKNEKTYPEYILHHLSFLPINSEERKERACYLLYLHYLIMLYKCTYKDFRRKDPCPDIPEPIKTNLLDSFSLKSDHRTRCVPKKFKDRQLCHILVLSLILEEYRMECNLLLKDLKVSVTRISHLLRNIGCNVKTVKAEKKEDDDVTDAVIQTTIIAALQLPNSNKKATPNKLDTSLANTENMTPNTDQSKEQSKKQTVKKKVSSKSDTPRKSVTKSEKPTTPQKSVTKSDQPTTPPKSVMKSEKPTTPQKSVTKSEQPTTPPKSVMKSEKPTTPRKSVAKSEKPTTPRKSVTKSENPTTPPKNVTKSEQPTTPPKSVTKSEKPTANNSSMNGSVLKKLDNAMVKKIKKDSADSRAIKKHNRMKRKHEHSNDESFVTPVKIKREENTA